MKLSHRVLPLAALAILSSMTGSAFSASGNLYVADHSGKIVNINLQNGASTVLTSGGLLPSVIGEAIENSVSMFASSHVAHSVVRVNLASGSQSNVSQGNLLVNPDGIAFDASSGTISVADFPNARITAANSTTGAQTLVTQGNLLTSAPWVAIGPDGKLYVSDYLAGSIVKVDPATGSQTLVTSGNLLGGPEEGAFGPDGKFYVADLVGNRIVRVDPLTGAQALVSQGNSLNKPQGLAIDQNGTIYAGNYDDGRVVAVNPANGAQSVFTSPFLQLSYGIVFAGSAPPPPTPPAAPATIAASDNQTGGVNVTWSNVADEAGYHLKRDGIQIALLGPDDTTYFDVPGAGRYLYCVDAFNLGGNSAAVCDSGSQRDFITAPRISYVRDLPNDQGGKVGVAWLASELDAPGKSVTQYRVWRRLPPSLGAPAMLSADGMSIRMRPVSDAIYYWEAVATLPAAHLAGYGYTATTPQDSLPNGNPYTAFFISALTNDPTVFYDSDIDSGYSVDNLAPAAPTPFAGSYLPDGVHLHWNPNHEADLSGYRLWRGVSASFVPSPENLVAEVADTGYVDTQGTLSYYYKLSAADVHGNQSLFSLVSPDGPVATLATVIESGYDAGRVNVVWLVSANPGIRVDIYRHDPVLGWQFVANSEADAGKVVYQDASVTPGTRYGYRLEIHNGDQVVSVTETWVDVPALQLALVGIVPNPGPRATISAALVLPNSDAARLELYDVSGRRVATQTVSGLPAGYHDVRLTAMASVRAGVYVLRLIQGGNSSSTKAVISP